ncbi:hypothetical protein [Nonomuraea sp. KM90]|uniref:hypothetical protein n=1 Tax=Nonomuraea sp. KM90 TaxID=3457428 RepID=UPI003FCE0A2E
MPALFCGILPWMLDRYVKRRGPIRAGSGKPIVLVAGSAMSVLTGLGVLMAGSAPSTVLACSTGLFGILVGIAVTSQWRRPDGRRGWDLSIHAASAAGAAGITLLTVGVMAGVIAALLTAAVAWSRVRTHRRTHGEQGHTVPEVIAGAILGAATCSLAYHLIA